MPAPELTAVPESSRLPIERHTLDNGLRVVLQPDARLPLAAVNLWYEVGSVDERPGKTGMAHLFEHMLFQGSENVGTNDHFRWIQQVGGVANGSTWYDRTNYYETLPANYLDLGLWLESDRMGFLLPALDEEKLENQREVVMNERRQRIDNQPYGRAFERLHELLYPERHPYHWPVIGYMEDIASMSLEDVELFFRSHYAPDNAVLSLVGDFEPADAMRRVERYFGQLPPRTSPEGRPEHALPEPATEVRETLIDDVQLARVYIGYCLPSYGSEPWYAADLLATALTSGKSSPMYEDLVYSRQISQDVGAFILPTAMGATFTVVSTVRPGVEPTEVEAAMMGHLKRAVTGELGADHISRARNKIITDYFDELQGYDRRADLLSHFTTFFDDPERVYTEPFRYQTVRVEDIVQLAGQHLTPARRVVLTVVGGGNGS